MRPLFSWLKARFQTFQSLPDYLRAIIKQWMTILFGETVVAAAFLIWWALANPKNPPLIAIFVVAMFVAGYFAWLADHARLQQRICITKVLDQTWWNADFKRDAIAYYFEIINKSEALSIYGVRVQLAEIIPMVPNFNWLPVPLRQKHDNPLLGTDYKRTFDLNPSEPKHIDFVSSFLGAREFHVEHIAGPGVNNSIPVSGEGHHRLKVMVTAQDMPILYVWFDVWMNGVGVLQCEME